MGQRRMFARGPLMEHPTPMSNPASMPEPQELRKLEHDVKNAFNAISMGLDVLRSVRTDEREFEEVCAAIDTERRRASALIAELFAAARSQAAN
jgi:hypothetical protein